MQPLYSPQTEITAFRYSCSSTFTRWFKFLSPSWAFLHFLTLSSTELLATNFSFPFFVPQFFNITFFFFFVSFLWSLTFIFYLLLFNHSLFLFVLPLCLIFLTPFCLSSLHFSQPTFFFSSAPFSQHIPQWLPKPVAFSLPFLQELRYASTPQMGSSSWVESSFCFSCLRITPSISPALPL